MSEKRAQGNKPHRRHSDNSSKRILLITVAGRGEDYWKYTLTLWCYEVKELIEQEYNVKVCILTREEDSTLPRVYVNNVFVFEGVPGEEGYLIELLKGTIERILYV